jgi:deoxyribodipyrimidine photo-lyase
VSPRELESKLPRGDGASAYARQLCRRDFYAQILLRFPANARSEYQDRYRGSIRWSRAEKRFDAWREGFPLVDAGMPIVDHAAARRDALERYRATV